MEAQDLQPRFLLTYDLLVDQFYNYHYTFSSSVPSSYKSYSYNNTTNTQMRVNEVMQKDFVCLLWLDLRRLWNATTLAQEPLQIDFTNPP